MSDQQADTSILRLLIREAVEREFANGVAQLRTDQQVQLGMLKQYDRDLAAFKTLFGDLDELVRGNPKQNLVGLAEQISAQHTVLETLRRDFNSALNDARRDLLVEINTIKLKQDEATKSRDALINQLKGARWALLGLGIITGLPFLDTLNKLLHIV